MTDCIFCKIVAGEIPSSVVYKDDAIFAFSDVHPQAPVHVLIVPRKHIADLNSASDSDGDLLGKIQLAARKIARQKKIDAAGYRLVLNCGPDAGQAVNHLHYHLLGGRAFGWPPG